MNLGWCDVCLLVASAKRSREFYEKLGFHQVEGDDEQGWAVVANDVVRLGLYERRHMGNEALSLNFRGGDVPAIARSLQEAEIAMESGPTQSRLGGWSANVRDPDGYLLFFDAEPGETKKR
jgi:catechol 2,3-dioxygenase-like lactoylglutathione lyase family enzyme